MKFNKHKNVKIYPYALWDDKCQLIFSLGRERERVVGEVYPRIEGECDYINAIPLDRLVENKKIKLIALDVEGAELQAIKGAGTTIMKNKPKLAISLYHKLKDYYEIPLFVHENYPEYKLYFRHHASTITESVLYAV